MIKAEFWFQPETDEISHVCISGHAGQNVYGYDVICAGVSALTIATINGLEEYVGISTDAIIKEGYTEFSIHPENETQMIQALTLTHTLYLALVGIQEENNNFIEVTIMEEKI